MSLNRKNDPRARGFSRPGATLLTMAVVTLIAAACGHDAGSGRLTAPDPTSSGLEPASRLPQGTEVRILVPANSFPGTQPDTPDVRLTFLKATSTTTLPGCVHPDQESTAFPKQEVVADGPVVGWPPDRRLSVFVISRTTPIPQGTRVRDLVFEGPCNTATASLDTYQAVVQ